MSSQPAPRAAHILALSALLSSCAPAAAPAPAAVSPALAEVLAPDPVWPEVAAALESLRSRPEADVLISLGEENTRCSLVVEMDVKLLRCGEALLRAPTLAEMLKSINAGAMHRAYVLEGLSRPGAALEALGSPQPTFEPQPPNGVRWRQEAGGLAIEFRVEQRGQIVASYQGLDGPESFTAASPREAWRTTKERAVALEGERTQRRLAAAAERILDELLKDLELEGPSFGGIKLGESYKKQEPFKARLERSPLYPIDQVFPGDSSRWLVSNQISRLPGLHAVRLDADTIQDRVVSVARSTYYTEAAFPERRTVEPPCELLRGWVERRLKGPRGDERPPTLHTIEDGPKLPRAVCVWKLERGDTRAEIQLSLSSASITISLASGGTEELMARAKEIHQARLRKASCHLCRHVRVGNRHRYGVRVVSVDGKACTMTLQNENATDPLSSLPFEVPCDPSRAGDLI